MFCFLILIVTFECIFTREGEVINVVEKIEKSKKGRYDRKCVGDGKVAEFIVKKLVFICWLCHCPGLCL